MFNIHLNSVLMLVICVVFGSSSRVNDDSNDENVFEVGNVIPHGDEEFQLLRQANPLPNFLPCRNNKRLECAGCNTIIVCDTIGRRPISCGSATPYCVSSNSPYDTCSAVAGNNNQCPAGGGGGGGGLNGGAPGFTCTGPGYFPDPSNCASYHICSAPFPAVSTNLMCPQPLIYDVITKTCRRPLFAGGCKVAECTVESAGVRPIQVFGKNQQFFVFCRVEVINGQNVAVPTIYKCADGARFNGITCEYKCPGRGRFAHSDYPERYFECNWVNLVLVGTEQVCPVDTIFERKRRICVRNPASAPANSGENMDDGLNAMPAVGRTVPLSSSEDADSQEAIDASFQLDDSRRPLQEVKTRPSRKQ